MAKLLAPSTPRRPLRLLGHTAAFVGLAVTTLAIGGGTANAGPPPSAGTAQIANGVLKIDSNSNQFNDVRIGISDSYITVSDEGYRANSSGQIGTAVKMAPGAGCTAGGNNASYEVRCPAAGITSVSVNTKDLDDNVFNLTNYGSTIHTGLGNDSVSGGSGADTVYGGDGMDFLHGRATTLSTDVGDALYGEGGDDFLKGHEGVDQLDGGTGTADRYIISNDGDVVTNCEIAQNP